MSTYAGRPALPWWRSELELQSLWICEKTAAPPAIWTFRVQSHFIASWEKNHISHAENEKWTHPDDTAKQLAALQHDVHWFSEVWRAPSESIIENIWIFWNSPVKDALPSCVHTVLRQLSPYILTVLLCSPFPNTVTLIHTDEHLMGPYCKPFIYFTATLSPQLPFCYIVVSLKVWSRTEMKVKYWILFNTTTWRSQQCSLSFLDIRYLQSHRIDFVLNFCVLQCSLILWLFKISCFWQPFTHFKIIFENPKRRIVFNDICKSLKQEVLWDFFAALK